MDSDKRQTNLDYELSQIRRNVAMLAKRVERLEHDAKIAKLGNALVLTPKQGET